MVSFQCKVALTALCIFFLANSSRAQTGSADTSNGSTADTASIVVAPNEQAYHLKNGQVLIYTKPKPFGFITNLPRDAAGIASAPFKKESIKPLILVAGSTIALLFLDQPIVDGVRQFSRNIHLSPDERYKDVLSLKLAGKNTSILKVPENINTGLYMTGQGFPSLLFGAGLFTYGKIKKDYRALNTASQLAESFILMAVGTQLVKHITGRETPGEATRRGGTWRFFPSFKEYQNHTPRYDAFPSGHLATLMSTVTTLTENYPEKKYIKPIGYSIIGLVGYAMINNEVHWASDYPLAIGLGYLCAKVAARNNRRVENKPTAMKHKGEMHYSLNYNYGHLMPGLTYTF